MMPFKNIYIFLCILFLTVPAVAQHKVVANAVNTNVLYIGIDYPLYEKVNTDMLKAWQMLAVGVAPYDDTTSYKIIDFNVFYQPGDSSAPTLLHNIGSMFHPALLALLQKVKVNSIIYIENINILCPDKVTRKIPGIAFKINSF